MGTKKKPKQLLATVRCLFGAPLAAHSGVPKSLLGLPLGALLGDPAGHRDHSPAPPGRPATPGPAQNPVKHEGLEHTNQTNACGSTSQAHLKLIKGRA